MDKFESIKSKITPEMVNRALDASDSATEFLDLSQSEGWDADTIDMDKSIDMIATMIHDGMVNDVADMVKAEINE